MKTRTQILTIKIRFTIPASKFENSYAHNVMIFTIGAVEITKVKVKLLNSKLLRNLNY